MAHNRPRMLKSTIDYFAWRQPDYLALSGLTANRKYDLDHAIISKSMAQGLPATEWIKIHSPCNILKIEHERHLNNRPPLVDRIRSIVMRHGYEEVKEWFDSINWKSHSPFVFPPEEDVT